MEKIETEKAPKAIGPYSQAIVHNGLIFVSGQIGMLPNGEMQPTIEAQTEQIIKNLKSILEAAGSSLENALKVNVYLENMENFQKMNDIYAKHFTNKPARATIQAKLPKNAMIEIDMIAAQ